MYHYIYFIKSNKNGKIYVGKTSKDPKMRLYEHNHGSNAFTKVNGPFTLIYFEQYHCSSDASAREKYYKSGFGRQIKQLIVEYILRTRSSVGESIAFTLQGSEVRFLSGPQLASPVYD